MATTQTKKKVGRPRKELDLKLVEELAGLQCTDGEIAAALRVDQAVISRRKKDDPAFLTAYTQGREDGKSTLRRVQWQAAKQGNARMMEWLGKQYLDQRDKRDSEYAGPDVAAIVAQIGAVLGSFIREFVPQERWDEARQRVREIRVDDFSHHATH